MGFDFNYERSDEDIINRKKGEQTDYHKTVDDSVFPVVKLPDGEHTFQFRILPPNQGKSKHWGIEIHTHYGLGAAKERHICPRKWNNHPCAACERFFAAHNRGDAEEKKIWKASGRVLVRIIDRDEDHGMPKLWDSPLASIDRELIGLCHDVGTGESMIRLDDPVGGRDFRFSKEGKGLTTRYKSIRVLDPSPISTDEDYANKVLALIKEYPLLDLINTSTSEEIADVIGDGSSTREAAKAQEDTASAPVSEADFVSGELGGEIAEAQEASGELF